MENKMRNKSEMTPRNEKEVIVYQNQSHLAFEWFKHLNVKPSIYDVFLLTDFMVDYARYGHCKEWVKRHDEMVTYLIEKYDIPLQYFNLQK